jgi:hypothetical protein
MEIVESSAKKCIKLLKTPINVPISVYAIILPELKVKVVSTPLRKFAPVPAM